MQPFDLATVLIGESFVMRELRAVVERLAPTPLAVLIQGPTGAGKELVAQALHSLSGRRGALVPVNVAAVPDSMFEDEFFGHVKGAFTGALGDRVGRLTEAHRGTLFLDEVGSLTLVSQPKLLRALETHQFRPVGARVDSYSEFRSVAATNEDLDAMIGNQQFRRDLRRRLAACVVRVPPLCERRSDIPELVYHFARRVAADAVIEPDGLRYLEAYDWPDNVRELRQVVECSVILGDRRCITARAVRSALGLGEGRRPTLPRAEIDLDRARLFKMLEECAWDTAQVAEKFGVHRATIYRRMSRCGLSRPSSGRPVHSHDSRKPYANVADSHATRANREQH